MTATNLDTLAEALRTAARAYYDGVTEVMTDVEYDDGIEQLRIAVAEHPALEGQFDDLLNTVAGGQSAGGDVEHPTLMGSLDKVVGLDAVAEFVRKVGHPVIVEPKLDGLPIRVEYRNGIFDRAVTRGDGRTGEDVTEAVKNLAIKGLPRIANTPLAENGKPVSFEVRGEVFLADADFPRASKIRQSLGGEPFKNPRNAAAGILRKGDSNQRGTLSFACYDATFAPINTALWSHDEVITTVERSGITSARSLLADRVNTITTSPEQVIADIAYMGENRAVLGFPIDGAVIKAATLDGRTALGEGTRAPKWAVAFKYEAEVATTIIEEVTWAVGKTGVIAPRARVTPVFVGGTTVTYASLHNPTDIERKCLMLGLPVYIKRAGDVIPRIEGPAASLTGAETPIVMPETCPQCDGPIDKSSVRWRCQSSECFVLGRIVYALSRDVLDVDGAGTEIATALVEQDVVKDIADLFTLDAATLANLPLEGGRLLGQKVATKIAAELDKAKGADWNRVICALALRMTGRTMSRRLAGAFPTADALLAATVNDLMTVDGIAEGRATVIRKGLDEVIASGVLARLAAAGVNMGTEKAASTGSLPLTGMTVVISGSIPGLTRTEAQEVVEANGGKASSSVSKTTSLLVAEPSTSSKYVKAQQLGIKIVEPAEFLAMIGR